MISASKLWRIEVLVGLVWLLPLLIPYGLGLWTLQERGWLLWWLGGMTLLTMVWVLPGRLIRRRAHGVRVRMSDANAAEAEKRAREALRRVVADAGAADLASGRAVEKLIRRVLREVALAWHPKASRAELRFTVPEALMLAEILARRLRRVIKEDLPSLQHIEVAHVVRVNEHVGPARKVWRVVRAGRFALDPAGALAAELRRGVLQSLGPAVMDSLKGKAAALLARETGEAAILLYSGRLRGEGDEVREAPAREAEEAGPLTILLAGQPNTGKSSLVNALSGRGRAVVSPLRLETAYQGYALEDATAGELVLVDGPGLGGEPDGKWLEQAVQADLIVWVGAAHRADRAPDQRALEVLRKHFERNFRFRQPPLMLVLTHADRLDPPREWQPPYDVGSGRGAKERAMRAALEAACEALDVPWERAVIVSTADPADPWIPPEFWAGLQEALPAAMQARLERLMARRSKMDGVSDAVRTLPGALKQLRKF